MNKLVKFLMLVTLVGSYFNPVVIFSKENTVVPVVEETSRRKTDMEENRVQNILERSNDIQTNLTQINQEKEVYLSTEENEISVSTDNKGRPNTPSIDRDEGNGNFPDHIINGSFEEPSVEKDMYNILNQDLVLGWMTTASDSAIEIANGTGGAHKFEAADGKQWAEINARNVGELHQTVKTIPGDKLIWELWHAGRDQVDTMNINIGTVENHPIERTIFSPNRLWTKYTGEYIVPEGQYETYFGFQSVKSFVHSYGNYIDGVKFYIPGTLKAIKSVDKSKVFSGDAVTYTIDVINESERGILYDIIVTDSLPSGMEIIPNTLQINGEQVNNEAEGNNISTIIPKIDKEQIIKVSFQARVTRIEDGKIRNLATVIDKSCPNNTQKPEVTIDVLCSPGELESDKKVYSEGKQLVDDQRVKSGDILEYRVTTKNKAGIGTIINNVMVSDTIPIGLGYEVGTLKATYSDGTIKDLADNQVIGQRLTTENLGSLKSGESVTVSFKVNITEQATGTIKNVAMVEGTVPSENPNESDVPLPPHNPEVSIKVPSEVMGEKLVNGKKNNTAHIGDILSYKIKLTHEDRTGQWNGDIIDILPENLSYVQGTTILNGEVQKDDSVWCEKVLTISDININVKNQIAIIEFKAKIEKEAGGTIVVNTAEAKPAPPLDPTDPNSPHDIEIPEVSTEVNLSPGELESDKKVYSEGKQLVDDQRVKSGDILEYRVTTKNKAGIGTIINNVMVSDTIPIGLGYEVGTLKATYSDGTIKDLADNQVIGQRLTTENLGSLKSGESVTVSFKVNITEQATGTIKNVAMVEGTVPSENPNESDVPLPPHNPEVSIFAVSNRERQKESTDNSALTKKRPSTINFLNTGETTSYILFILGIFTVLGALVYMMKQIR